MNALQTERDRVRAAEAHVEAVRGELADLQARQAAVAALVEQRRGEQRDAALESERAGGRDSRELTRRVAALQEGQARLDALAELVAAKEAEVSDVERALGEAVRDLRSAEHQARVAELAADARRLSGTVAANFEALAVAAGDLDCAIFELDQLDRSAAQAVAAGVTNAALNAALFRRGCVGIVDAGGAQHGLTVPSATKAPALVAVGRQTATLGELIAQRQGGE